MIPVIDDEDYALPDEHTVLQYSPDWDHGIVERFRHGDREAFAEIYRVHHPAIFRFLLSMTGDPNQAEETTQEVFVWLIHHPEKFDPKRGALVAFLLGVARKMLRRSERFGRKWVPLEDGAGTGKRPAELAAVDREIDVAALRSAIAVLPIRYREAVVLCDLESRSYEEAAHLIGCALGTLRSRLRRGRKLLERKFQPTMEKRRWFR